MILEDESPEDWVQTFHDRIFYRTRGDTYLLGEFVFATYIVNELPDWKVVITMNPDRDLEMSHEHRVDRKIIHLDFDADGLIRRVSRYPRRDHPEIRAFADTIIQLAEDSDSDSA